MPVEYVAPTRDMRFVIEELVHFDQVSQLPGCEEFSSDLIEAILEEAGMTFEDVVKASIFIKDMHQFAQINEVYGSYFDADTAPARETVEVANLPRFVNVEISMIAIK